MYEQAAIVALTGYAMLAAGHYLIGLTLPDLPEYQPGTDHRPPTTDHWPAIHAENILRKVRRTKRRYGWKARENTWKSEIRAEWQYKAITLAPDAFELFLVKEVWGFYGLSAERWEVSPLRTKTGIKTYQKSEWEALAHA